MVAATEQGDLVPDDVLQVVDYGDSYSPAVLEEYFRRYGTVPPFEDLLSMEMESRSAYWRDERRKGAGLQLQPRIVAAFVNGSVHAESWGLLCQGVPADISGRCSQD